MPTDQAAVILVHGATLNARSWDPVRRLIDPRLRVLAPETEEVRSGPEAKLEGLPDVEVERK